MLFVPISSTLLWLNSLFRFGFLFLSGFLSLVFPPQRVWRFHYRSESPFLNWALRQALALTQTEEAKYLGS